jgi:hypothetical protein
MGKSELPAGPAASASLAQQCTICRNALETLRINHFFACGETVALPQKLCQGKKLVIARRDQSNRLECISEAFQTHFSPRSFAVRLLEV